MGKRTIYFGRGAAFKNWLNSKSETYSKLCGEDFTHREVVIMNAIILDFILVVGLVEEHIIIAGLVALLAVPLVWAINRK